MEKTMKVQKSSELYRNINELHLTASERQAAIGAIAISETLVSAVDRAIKFIAPITHGIPSSPKLKHL